MKVNKKLKKGTKSLRRDGKNRERERYRDECTQMNIKIFCKINVKNKSKSKIEWSYIDRTFDFFLYKYVCIIYISR